MATPAPLQEPPDFSLVLGGPLYQMLRQAHLTGSTLGLLLRQVVLSVLGCWVPFPLVSTKHPHEILGRVIAHD
jgi:hypothetical protein